MNRYAYSSRILENLSVWVNEPTNKINQLYSISRWISFILGTFVNISFQSLSNNNILDTRSSVTSFIPRTSIDFSSRSLDNNIVRDENFTEEIIPEMGPQNSLVPFRSFESRIFIDDEPTAACLSTFRGSRFRLIFVFRAKRVFPRE